MGPDDFMKLNDDFKKIVFSDLLSERDNLLKMNSNQALTIEGLLNRGAPPHQLLQGAPRSFGIPPQNMKKDYSMVTRQRLASTSKEPTPDIRDQTLGSLPPTALTSGFTENTQPQAPQHLSLPRDACDVEYLVIGDSIANRMDSKDVSVKTIIRAYGGATVNSITTRVMNTRKQTIQNVALSAWGQMMSLT